MSGQKTADVLFAELKNDPMIMKLLGMLDFTPDFTFESLKELEATLDRMYPDGIQMVTTAIPPAWYLGETIIRNIPGAKWVLNGTNMIDLVEISVPTHDGATMTLRPGSRVFKFLDDRTDSLYVFANMARQMAMGLINTSDMQTGKWYHHADGSALRTYTMDKE